MRQFTWINMTMSQVLPHLLKTNLATLKEAPKNPNTASPRYNPNTRCDYHSKSPGHFRFSTCRVYRFFSFSSLHFARTLLVRQEALIFAWTALSGFQSTGISIFAQAALSGFRLAGCTDFFHFHSFILPEPFWFDGKP